MVCIYCAHETQVINSRPNKRPNQVWRRRQCQTCRAVFTTHETADWATAVRVQRKSRLEPFSRDKLFISLLESLRHRDTAIGDAGALTATVTAALRPINGIIGAGDIVEAAKAVLNRFDQVAAVHYGAFHKH